MSKFIHFGPLKIDPLAIGSQGNAILGIRDSGKTYTATELAEQLMDSGIPIIAFDPIGVWRYLRVPGAGRGYPVVVAGGEEGDLPLTVASAPEIVRSAMANGVSLVIDLFDINLSKADWKRIVTSCLRVLLHENSKHGMRHVFVEEAAEFAPQRIGPDQGQVYAEMEKLARMGGNARLGYTLINQRAEEVNKAVLELCDNLFLHRQKGRNSLTALSKWLDIGNAKDGKKVIESLPTLPTGECWAWLAGTDTPTHVKVPRKNSLHPDRRVMRGDGTAKLLTPVSVDTFVSKMRETLKTEFIAAPTHAPVAVKEIVQLKREITLLRAQLETAKSHQNPPFPTDALQQIVAIAQAAVGKAGSHSAPAQPFPARAVGFGKPEARPAATVARVAGATGLTNPEQRIVDAIAWLESVGVTEPEQPAVAFLAGYTYNTGGFNNPKGRLNQASIINYVPGGRIRLTPAGQKLANYPSAIATNEELHARVLAKLPNPEQRILRPLLECFPAPMAKDTLAHAANYAPNTGGFNNPCGRLRTLGLIDYPEKGMCVARSLLFPEAP